MNKIKKLTQVIRDNSENELCYGTLRTLKMIDDESDILENRIMEYKIPKLKEPEIIKKG